MMTIWTTWPITKEPTAMFKKIRTKWLVRYMRPSSCVVLWLSVGYKASSEPPYASHTLVQIILHFIPKLSTQSILLKSYFWLIVCKCPYFYKKLKKHCLVLDADISKQNLPALMASEITLIWRLDPMTQLPDNEFFLWMNESKSNYINQECFSIEEIERIK